MARHHTEIENAVMRDRSSRAAGLLCYLQRVVDVGKDVLKVVQRPRIVAFAVSISE